MMSIKDLSLDDTQTQILKTCSGKDLLKNDRISDLPDDILISILSSFTLKEAGSTSVLSMRWRDVWAYVTSLKFYPSYDYLKDTSFHEATRLERGKKIIEEERKYVRWVDAVVSSHKADIIDEFTVTFPFRVKRYQKKIGNWLRFALAKRVKRLELDIFPPEGGLPGSFSYDLPILPPVGLTSLKLCWVSVTGEVLEKLLDDCPTLEFLSVELSSKLVNLKVDGRALNLKVLKLKHVHMEYLEISAPNLISFEFSGLELSNWPLISTPKLAEVSIGDDYGSHLLGNIMELSSIFSQIEVLSLSAMDGRVPHGVSREYPVGSRIKMLEIYIYPIIGEELFDLSLLIQACPLLQKFVLKLASEYGEIDTDSEYGEIFANDEEWERKEACPHPQLKILEITGFTGEEAELSFIGHLIETAVSLEKISIKANFSTRDFGEPPLEERRARARTEAEGFRAILKPGTELEIE